MRLRWITPKRGGVEPIAGSNECSLIVKVVDLAAPRDAPLANKTPGRPRLLRHDGDGVHLGEAVPVQTENAVSAVAAARPVAAASPVAGGAAEGRVRRR